MKKSIISLVAILALLVMIFAFTGCKTTTATTAAAAETTKAAETTAAAETTKAAETTAASAKKIVIGAVILTREHVFWNLIEKSLVAKAKELGVELIIADGKSDSDVQYGQVQDFITQGVSAIIMSPASSAGSEAASALAKKANIPFFSLNILSKGDYITFIGTNETMGGNIAGEYAAKLLNKKGNTAIITYDEIEQCVSRAEGFKEIIKKYPDMKVLGEATYSGDTNKAASVTQDFITKYPDLNLIFAVGDPAAIGAVETIKSQGAKIKVIGYDGNPESIDGIKKDGDIWVADVAQDPIGSSSMMVETIVKYLKDGVKPAPQVLIDPYIIDKAYIDANGL